TFVQHAPSNAAATRNRSTWRRGASPLSPRLRWGSAPEAIGLAQALHACSCARENLAARLGARRQNGPDRASRYGLALLGNLAQQALGRRPVMVLAEPFLNRRETID